MTRNERRRERYATRRAAGVCPFHPSRPAVAGSSRCAECAASSRVPCERCRGPKGPGIGLHFCEACTSLDALHTLEQLIADQAKEMRMGRRVHRQRFGERSTTRARTLSLSAMEPWEMHLDPWQDPVGEAWYGPA